jgi:Family of unknown function (DUF6519)/Malectin domain
MAFDASRFTFDVWNDYLGVVMQQGRVQLDSDWNEWVAEVMRRLQVGTVDILGTAAVPQATTPNGFLITPSSDGTNNVLTIGRGRIYVDGLLAENHGLPTPSPQLWADGSGNEPQPPALSWSPILGELTGTSDTPYTQQPYYPSPPPLPLANDPGPHVVYLDVWQRELTHLQQPDLIEKAVGIDTAERLQTVWQVKLLADTGAGTTCATDLSGLLIGHGIHPSGAQLTTDLATVAQPTDPCQVPTGSGYKGLENQLYRVEIHQGSSATANASFKWSRDGATVATLVTQITAPDTLIVQSVGKDDVLRFNPLDWIEITDDVQELAGLPGEVYQVKTVEDATLTVTLQTPLANSTDYPVDSSGNTVPARHTRIRRWDQSGKVLDSNGNIYWDLDSPANSSVPVGTIPLPPAGTALVLESGVTVSFSLDPNITDGIYASRDYWAFAARTADGTVEKLTLAPPRGIRHHYTQLAVVTFPDGVASCRRLWPPASSATGCCCTVSISPADLTGAVTLQSILDQYQQQPDTIISLEAGSYQLTQPLRLGIAHSGFTIDGCGGGAVLSVPAGSVAAFQDGMVVLDNANGVTLRGLHINVPEVPFSAPGGQFAGLPVASLAPQVQAAVQGLYVSIGVRAVNATGLTVESCAFDFGDFEEDSVGNGAVGIGVFGSGANDGLRLSRNEFGGVGPFLAGYLLASAVAFNNPPAPPAPPGPPVPPIPAPPVVTNVGAGAEAARAAAKGGAVSGKAASAKARSGKPAARGKPAAAQAQAAMPPVVPRPVGPGPIGPGPIRIGGGIGPGRLPGAARIPIQSIYGQTIVSQKPIPPDIGVIEASNYVGTFHAFVPSALNLAANGGSVLPATLLEAVIEDNSFSGMTIGVLILAEAGSVAITGNQADYGGGFWILDPRDVNLVVFDPSVLFGSAIAMGYPLPANDTSKSTQIAAAVPPARIFAGKAAYTDSQGNVWTPDVSAANLTIGASQLNQPATPAAVTNALPATQDQPLYQSERFGAAFSYTFANLPVGYYQVTLKLAEIFDTVAGKRLMNVAINYDQVLTDFDVFAATGGENIATDQVFSNIASEGGQIVIQFTGVAGSADPNAKIAAVEIASQLYQYPGALNDMGKFLAQLEVLAQQAYFTLSSPLTLRVDGNTIDGATDLALLVVDQGAGQAAGQQGTGQGLLTMNGNVMRRVSSSEQELYWLSATAAIAGVTVCTVTGNQFLNTTDARLAFLLSSPPPAYAVTVTGNVFQGQPSLPQRQVDPSVPAPMNQWLFLNTLI